jgi:hypothetical protein
MDKVLEEILKSDKEDATTFEKEDVVLAPLLSEIELIADQTIQWFVRSVLLKAGPFWYIPSSHVLKDKPPDEYLPTGNVLHTKRVVRVVELLCDSYNCTEDERDKLIAAALLHDITKGVVMFDGEEPTYDTMHPYTVDKFVKSVYKLDEVDATEGQSSVLYVEEMTVLEIMRLIRCHQGPWSPIPETNPITVPEMILHTADRMASKLHWIIDGDEIREERWLITPHGEQE